VKWIGGDCASEGFRFDDFCSSRGCDCVAGWVSSVDIFFSSVRGCDAIEVNVSVEDARKISVMSRVSELPPYTCTNSYAYRVNYKQCSLNLSLTICKPSSIRFSSLNSLLPKSSTKS